jgi:crotonobetainyl-CoA:carnitine CoA-transferase CaiB-like acyl-CoA transferase
MNRSHTPHSRSPSAGTSNRGPLDGIVVLDLTRVMSGPYCSMMLGDMGARVIKIEHPMCGDDTRHWGPPFQEGESAYFLSVNRNKESVALDFSVPEGRALLDRLLAQADVVMENFRPGVMARLGLDYASLSAVYPRLVYCSISGFGQSGPRSQEPGYDAVAQAAGGLMSITGLPDGPPIRPGLPIADLASGMFAASGILAALFDRERTGRAQAVDVALLDSVAALLTYQAAAYFATGVAPQRLGNRHATIAPYDLFNASDGEFILAVGNDAQFQRCCEVIGLDALARDARFATNRDRVSRYDELRDVLAAQFRTAPRATWLERLRAAGVPAGPVHDVREFFADRYVRDRGLVTTMDHASAGPLDMVRSPISMSGTPTSVKTPPPLLGQHTAAVLKEILGLDDEEVRQLEAQRVIACARHP